MPNEKAPSSDELLGALEKAHLAGDTEAARELASWHYELYPPAKPQKEPGIIDKVTSLFTGETPASPQKTEINPGDGPSMSSYEPSILDRIMEIGGGSAARRARASNEAAARRIAEREGVPVEDVYTSIGGSRPMLNPEGRAPVRAAAEGAGVVAEQLPYVPQAAANTVLRVIRGGDETADNTSWLDSAIDTTQPPEPKDPDPNYRAFYGIGESLGYSLATLTAATVAGAAGTATGTPLAGAGAAFSAGGAVAYRASKDQFLERVKEGLDQRSMELYGRQLNQQEWEDAYQKHEAAAQKYGAWEAIPEAVSNLIFIRALSLPLRGASRETITEVAKRAAQTMASEQTTETATAVGQSQAEAEAGMGKPLSVAEAFRQQAIQTALVTGLLGGAGAGARYGYDTAEAKIAPQRVLGRELEQQAEQIQAAPAPAGAAIDALAPENAQVVQQPARRPMAELVAEKLQEKGVDPAILFKAADTGAFVPQSSIQQPENVNVPFDIPAREEAAAAPAAGQGEVEAGAAPADEQAAATIREQQTPDAIAKEIDDLGNEAQARMDDWVKENPTAARINAGMMDPADFMTPEERQRMHLLKLALPQQDAAAARSRIQERIKERKGEARPTLPPTFSVGPATVKTTPIEAITYRETGREGLESLIRATYVNAPGDSLSVHVSDSRDLALGQGDNKGIMIQFRSGAISGKERQKPGITDQTGREFVTDFVARDPIDQVLIPMGTKLSSFTRQALARNFARQETPAGMLYTRKGATVDQSLAEAPRVTDMPAGERRANDRARKLYDQMTREGLIDELLSHELTGIKGRRAFVVEAEGAKRIVSIDADSLKWINDNMAPEAGDRLLQAVANHLVEEFGADYVYHISGDEFYLVDDGTLSGAQIAEGMRRVEERLGKAMIEVEKAGDIITKRGLSVTYGIGQNRRVADAELKREKTAREQRGQRAGRGQEPPGVSRRPAGPAGESAAWRQGESDRRPDGGRADEGPAPRRREVKKQAQPTEYRILHRVSPSGEEFIVQSKIGSRWNSSEVPSIEAARESIASRGADPDTAPVIRQEWSPKTKRYNVAKPPRQRGGGDTHAMFAGERADTADSSSLEAARERLAAGESIETIRQETGWYLGHDRKWRFEIDDSGATLKKPFPHKGQLWGDVYESEIERRHKAGESIWLTVGDVLDHPALFAAYPGVAEISLGKDKGSAGAAYSRPSAINPQEIRIGENVPMSQVANKLLHEIQHGIQYVEGFANGGSPSNFYSELIAKVNSASSMVRAINDQLSENVRLRDRLEARKHEPGVKEQITDLEADYKKLIEFRSDIVDDAAMDPNQESYKRYFRLAGEVEARNTQARQKLSAQERLQTPPTETEDVDGREVIVSFNGEVMDSAPAPANIYAAGTADGPMSNWQPIYRQLGVPPRPASGKFTLGDRTIELKPEDSPTRREGIRVMVQDIIGPRLYQGKVKGKSRLGFYRRRNSEVRTSNYDDVEVMAHEMAHYLDFDKRFNKAFQKAYKSQEFSAEVQSVSYTSADRVVESEGFAEFVRLWLTQYDQARARAPKFTKKFEDILREIPGLNKKMRRLQEEMHRWYLQGPRAQLRAKSGKELSQVQQIMQYMQTYPLERYRQEVIDKIHAAKVVERTIHGQIQDANASAYKQFQLVNGAESLHEAVIRDGTPTLNRDGSYSFNGKGLTEIFHPAARHGWERFNLLMDFFKAKRALELYQQGREHLFTGQEIAEGLKLADKYPEFREIFAEYQAFNGRMLDFYQQMGLIDKKQREAFSEMNKAYVPFHRVIEKVEEGMGPGSPSIGKRLTGGSMNTKDIAENIIEGLYSNIRGALIARAKQTLYKDIMKSQDGSLFAVKLGPDSKMVRADRQQMAEAVAGAMASLGFTVSKKGMILSGDIQADTITDTDEIAAALESNQDLLNFWTFGHKPKTAETYVDSAVIDGERVWFEVKSPLLVDMLTGMRGFRSGALMNAMFRVKNLQTRTVTSMLQFLGPNAVRDTLSAFVISKNRFIPVYSTLIGMGDAIFNTQVYKEFRLHGGGYGTRIEARTAETRSRRQLDLPSRNLWDAAAKLVAGWDRISSAFEYGSRLGDYRAARKAGKNPLEAAWEAREVSTDFSKIGRNELWAKFLRTVPFMNAGIQGLDKTGRELLEIKGEIKGSNLARLNAGKVRFLTAGGVLTLMTVLLWMLNKDDDRYKSLTDDQKARFWWIFIDGMDRPIKIPRPYDVGHLFATIPETALDYVKDRDGDAAAEALAWTLANTLGIGDYPGILQPFVEVARNKKFTGAPVIPERLIGVPAEYQFRDSTPILYRQIGEQLGVSPLAAEHYAKGFLRYVEAYISDATEAAMWNEKEWGERPFSGGPTDYLTQQFQGQRVPYRTKWTEGYFELKKRAAGVHQAMRVLQAQAIRDKKPLERFALDKVNQTLIGLDQAFNDIDKAFSDQDTILAGIRYNKGLTAKEKEQQIEHYYKLKNDALAKFYSQASAALKKVETELPE